MIEQKIYRLSDVVEIVNDNEYDPIDTGITKYVAGGHMESGQLYVTKFGNVIEDKEVIGSAFHKLFKKDHILCATRFPNLKKVGIATFDGLCANTTLVLKRKNNSDLIDGLLPFILQWDKFTEHAIFKTVGSTNPYVRWRDLGNFKFVLPSKVEQLKMKKLFWTIQTSIDRLEDLLEKTTNYMISKRKLLLTRGIGYTKLKNVPWLFGKKIEIPETWEITSINQICKKITSGGTPDTENHAYWNGKIPWIRGASLTTKYVLTGESSITKEGLENSSSVIIEKNNLIISSRVSLGNISINKIDVEINQYDSGIMLDHTKVLTDYVYWYLKFQMDKLISISQGTSIQGLLRKDIEYFPVFFPDLQEQKQIVSILSNIDEQINQQQSYLTNLKILRTSILNSKLTKEKIVVTN